MKDLTEAARARITRRLERAENELQLALNEATKYWPHAIGFASGERAGLMFNIIRSQEIRNSINGQPFEKDCFSHDPYNDWDCGAW